MYARFLLICFCFLMKVLIVDLVCKIPEDLLDNPSLKPLTEGNLLILSLDNFEYDTFIQLSRLVAFPLEISIELHAHSSKLKVANRLGVYNFAYNSPLFFTSCFLSERLTVINI